MDSSNPELRIWKHSHGTKGTSSLSWDKREALEKRSCLSIYRNTGKKQGENFRLKMQIGDFFYLCHGNDVKLFGQIVSPLENSRAKRVQRTYRIIRNTRKTTKFRGSPKYWAPNANSTSKLVPQRELRLFEKKILIPYFSLRLADLQRRAFDETTDDLGIDASRNLTDKEYVEARERLVRHERIERSRNRTLVRDAKNHFKSKHKKLYCEVCNFDFGATFGERGMDFIEAHHRIPIAKLKPNASLKITDLAMVCANCHRMLHQAPWISIKGLRKLL